MTAVLEAPRVKFEPPIDFDGLAKSLSQLESRMADAPVTEYVAGFLFNGYRDRVVLVKKNRPAWQCGKLNGVGGKVETGETPADAMRREFREEAGHDREDWDLFCTLSFPQAKVHFFRAFADADECDRVRTMTDEEIVVKWLDDVSPDNAIANIPWLIQMALCIDSDRAGMFEVKEVV